VVGKARELTAESLALTLTDGMEPGQCWAFCGDAGQLGIQLTHAIRVSHLTVGHQSKFPTTSAPKNLILWGLKPADSELCTTLGDVGGVGAPTPDFGSGYCGIRLLSDIYELSDSTLYQNFTTSVDHGHYYDRMIVQVVGNWGNPNFTRICRVHIYGRA
jgi:Sad1 / UNC-like C-terminal